MSAGNRTSPLSAYDRVAREVSHQVIHRYSTSFHLASRLLAPEVRGHVANIYALVRLADEIVDGAARESGVAPDAVCGHLDRLEAETDAAVTQGFSTNLIVHSFALTARQVGVTSALTRPFFASMRMDIGQADHTEESFSEYIYGSAEVVGLMCLLVFLDGYTVTPVQQAKLERGARSLGSAFQKVNFLRDLGEDYATLGRSYFPGITVPKLSEAQKHALLDDIDDDLEEAARMIGILPPGSRRAVTLAYSLFKELSDRLRATPARELVTRRVRVPNAVKARLAVQASWNRSPALVLPRASAASVSASTSTPATETNR